MCVPRDGTVRRVGTEADPLVAGCAEDAVRLELRDVRVGSEVVDALLFRALSATSLGLRLGGFSCRAWRLRRKLVDGTRRPVLAASKMNTRVR